MNAPDLVPGSVHRCDDGRLRTVWACPTCGKAFTASVTFGGRNGRTNGCRCPAGHWHNLTTLRTHTDRIVDAPRRAAHEARETDLGLARAWLERYDHLAAQLSHHNTAAALIDGTFRRLADITRRAASAAAVGTPGCAAGNSE